VLNPLALELLEGTLSEGDHVVVDVAPDGEALAFQRADVAEAVSGAAS
jgi:hypothetical protein